MIIGGRQFLSAVVVHIIRYSFLNRFFIVLRHFSITFAVSNW